MINLLPPDLKAEYRYARLNLRLRNWAFGGLAGLVGLAALAAFGLLFLSHSADVYRDINANKATVLKSQHADTVAQQVNTLSGNLSLMVKVLSKQVLFADLLKQLGTVTPPDVVLTGLSISQGENALNITAQSKTYEAGTQLFTNLNTPDNRIFSKADLQGVSCNPVTDSGSGALGSGLAGGAYNSGSGNTSSGSPTTYPCSVSIRALFVRDSPFLFINSQGTKS